MATASLRSAVTLPSFPLRCRSGHRKTLTQISPFRTPPKIKSILNLSNKSSIFSHKIDDWVHESAAEIVRNLRRAPLLVQVHDDGCRRRLETEEAVANGWEVVSKRWRDGEARVPDGVMLVEEIGGEGENEEKETRAWGIVVQGKGSGPRCYLLKTCRVGSGAGFGCTHFCLTRVRDFRETAFSQLNSCWLLN